MLSNAIPIPFLRVLSPSPRLTPKPLSTGAASIDDMTGGGIPRATLTEICGKVSSGRTSLLFSILRCGTEQGEFCVLVDAQNMFDPASAAVAGIQLNRLLWVRCSGNLDHALKATDLLIRAGGFGVVALDLSGTPDRITRRISLTSWFRLRHGAEHSGAALVVIGEQIHASSCSKLQLEVRQEQAVWSNKLLRGIAALAELRKRSHVRAVPFHIDAMREEANVRLYPRSR
jgi:hypothetical protein